MNIKEKVYFLTVKQAKDIAEKYKDDENYDLWVCVYAYMVGFSNIQMKRMEKAS